MSERKPILCGECLVNVEERTKADGIYMVRCPYCGQEDTLDNALLEGAQYELHEALGGTFNGIKSTGAIKVKVTGPPERRFRFIVDEHLRLR